MHSPWLRSDWCMTFEAKHQHFTRVAGNTNNYVNVCQTLAKRHQLHQCWGWQPESLFKEDHTLTPVTELFLQEDPANLKEAIAVNEKLWKSKYIVLNFIKYAIGYFFIFDLVHAQQIPEFLKHLHSYYIRETDELLMFKPEDEVDFHALDANRCEGKDLTILIHQPGKAPPQSKVSKVCYILNIK